MIPRVVTTVGPLWESEMVERARLVGALRITERAAHPAGVQRGLRERAARAVIVGAEIPWLSPSLVRTWQRSGAVVIGINPSCDFTQARLLAHWGCDLVLETPDPESAAAAIRAVLPPIDTDPAPVQHPTVVAVGGPHGAPGRTEVALGLAQLASRNGSCLLIEADPSPALGLRLGLNPPDRPYEPVAVGEIDVLLWRADTSTAGMLKSGWSRMWEYQTTVVDVGPGRQALREWPGRQVLVCRASPSGIVRAAYFLARLDPGPRTRVVVNHLDAEQQTGGEVVEQLAAWAGREPDATIGKLDDLRWGEPPPDSLLSSLAPLLAGLQATGPGSWGDLIASQHPKVADRNQVRVEHFGQALGPRRVNQVDEKPIPPGFGGGTRFYPGEVGAPGS